MKDAQQSWGSFSPLTSGELKRLRITLVITAPLPEPWERQFLQGSHELVGKKKETVWWVPKRAYHTTRGLSGSRFHIVRVTKVLG